MDNGAKSNGSTGSGIGGVFLGILIGAVAGGIAVMLYAPKSGPQTRALLKEEVDETQKMLQNWANDLRVRADRFSQIIRYTTESMTESEVQPRGDGHER